MAVQYFEDQFEDENVIFVFRKHPIVMRKGLIISSALLLLGPVYTLVLTYVQKSNPPTVNFFFLSLLVSFVIGIVVFVPWWIGWFYSVFIVTDQRLIQITQKGLFHRSVVDMPLAQIQMVNYEVAGIEQTFLGFGTIMMQTMIGDLVIHEVHHPAKIQKRILEILRTENIQPVAYPSDDSGIEE